MSKELKPVGFQPGHPRYGGKKKRTAQAARDLADSLGCDPLEFMMRVVNSPVFEQVEIQPDGQEKIVKITVPLDVRIDAAKAVANYLYPRLNAQHITSDAPLAPISEIDINLLMSDPALVEAAQTLALAASSGKMIDVSAEAERLPSPFTANRPPGQD